MKRREFLQYGVAGGLAAYAAYCGLELFREPTSEEIAAELYRSHGIFIPTDTMREFTQVRQVNRDKTTKTTPNQSPTLEEMKVFEQTLSLFPRLDELVSYLVLFRNNQDRHISGNYDDTFRARALSGEQTYAGSVVVRIQTPVLEELDYTKVYDEAVYRDVEEGLRQTLAFRGIVLRDMPMTFAGIKPKNHVERLKDVLAHEIMGHGFWFAVTRLWRSAYENWDLNTPLGWRTPDYNNPIMFAFAEAANWELITQREFIGRYGTGALAYVENFKDVAPVNLDELVWDRNPDFWGTPLERQVRVGAYGDYNSPPESFAEYIAAYYLYPEILTEKEYYFFTKIDTGLKQRNRKQFLNQVITDWRILL